MTVSDEAVASPSTLLGSPEPLMERYDVVLLDLDGVCFAGEAPIDHAASNVNAARDAGMRLSFVTNNASRAPHAVVAKLASNGIVAYDVEVFSAAMDGAALLAEHLPAGSRVLVVGGDGLREAAAQQGFVVVGSADDAPEAVLQGWDPSVDWAMMSEGLYAITRGALHVATNLDATLPTERGFALGNGSLVAAITYASGREPLAGGKPFPGIYRRALERAGGTRPLAVGDRLSTDHVGARAAGIPGLHVLTGVNTARDVLRAAPRERPTFVHTDLRGLTEPHPLPSVELVMGETWWSCADQHARVHQGRLELHGVGPLGSGPVPVSLEAYRALACAAWDAADAGRDVQVPELSVSA